MRDGGRETSGATETPRAARRTRRGAARRRLWLALAAVAVMVTAVSGSALATEQIDGEILDLACYIPKRAKGPAHQKCAQTCAEHGMPLGLLTDDDVVYLLYPRHGQESAFDDVKKLAGRRAHLTGEASERGGLHGFEVHAAIAAH
jgi:hypothetical protein